MKEESVVRDGKKRKRAIKPEKAIKIMSDYKKNNYNAKKTLLENGYSESYADTHSKYTIEAAKDKIADGLQLSDTSARAVADVADSLFGTVGVTQDMVVAHYRDIIEQNLNYAVKLRALEPLLRVLGVNWLDKVEDKQPSVVIKVSEAKNKAEMDIDAIEVGQKE